MICVDPPERNLNVILFKQRSLLWLLMCSSPVRGKSSRCCIVAVVTGAGDSPNGASVALLCFWPLDALLLEDWDITARSLFLGDKANVGPEGAVCSDSGCAQPPKLDFYALTMTSHSEPSVFLNRGDLSEQVLDGRVCAVCFAVCVSVLLGEGSGWVARGKVAFAFPWLCRGGRGLWGAARPLWGPKEAFSEEPEQLRGGCGRFQGWRTKLLCKDAGVGVRGLFVAPFNFVLLASGSEFGRLEEVLCFIIGHFKEGFKG